MGGSQRAQVSLPSVVPTPTPLPPRCESQRPVYKGADCPAASRGANSLAPGLVQLPWGGQQKPVPGRSRSSLAAPGSGPRRVGSGGPSGCSVLSEQSRAAACTPAFGGAARAPGLPGHSRAPRARRECLAGGILPAPKMQREQEGCAVPTPLPK